MYICLSVGLIKICKINIQFISQEHLRIFATRYELLYMHVFAAWVKVKGYCVLKFKAINQGQGQTDQNVDWSASLTKYTCTNFIKFHQLDF